jgi:hypothetical protein
MSDAVALSPGDLEAVTAVLLIITGAGITGTTAAVAAMLGTPMPLAGYFPVVVAFVASVVLLYESATATEVTG